MLDYGIYVKQCKNNPYNGNMRKMSWFFICPHCHGNGGHCGWCPWLAHRKNKQESVFMCQYCKGIKRHDLYCWWKLKYDPEPLPPLSMLSVINSIKTPWKPESFDE